MSMSAEAGVDLRSATATESSPRNSLITVRNLSKTYAGGTLGLDDVNFAIADGEFVGRPGRSGCGSLGHRNPAA